MTCISTSQGNRKSSNLTLCIYVMASQPTHPPSKDLFPPALIGGVGWPGRLRLGASVLLLPRHSACYYFGVRSEDERWAEEERSRWVLDVSRAIRLATGIAKQRVWVQRYDWVGEVGFFRKLLIFSPKDSQKGLNMECRLIIECWGCYPRIATCVTTVK